MLKEKSFVSSGASYQKSIYIYIYYIFSYYISICINYIIVNYCIIYLIIFIMHLLIVYYTFYLFCVHIHGRHSCLSTHVKIRQLLGVNSLLPSGHSWTSNSVHQVWQQAPLPSEPSHHPCLFSHTWFQFKWDCSSLHPFSSVTHFRVNVPAR